MKQLKSILFTALVASGCATEVEKPQPPAPEPPTCATTTCDPNATCSLANDGMPQCTCNAGFSGTGATCAAIQEPASCADILAANPSASDGDYTLYAGGAFGKPWPVYCANMTTTHSEYLPLLNVLGDANYGQYTAGGASGGTTVRTSYIRLRIDPVTFAVDIGDQTFAASTGSLDHSSSNTTVQSMPFGVAMSCDGTASGRADIDLAGTPFAVTSKFVSSDTLGSATMADTAGQVWKLEGGGGCGWFGPTGVAYNPFNTNGGGFILQLAYVE